VTSSFSLLNPSTHNIDKKPLYSKKVHQKYAGPQKVKIIRLLDYAIQHLSLNILFNHNLITNFLL